MSTPFIRSPRERNPADRRRVDLSLDLRKALQEARRVKGIPIKVLARRLGVGPSNLQKWQAGERRPSPEQLQAWREAVLL